MHLIGQAAELALQVPTCLIRQLFVINSYNYLNLILNPIVPYANNNHKLFLFIIFTSKCGEQNFEQTGMMTVSFSFSFSYFKLVIFHISNLYSVPDRKKKDRSHKNFF